MLVPNEVTENIDKHYPFFEARIKAKGWMGFPTGKDLINEWYKYVYENFKEVEVNDTEELE